MQQLQQVNYGMVVGLKTLKCELQRLKRAKCDVERDIVTDVSNTVIQGGYQTLKISSLKKREVEVSSATNIQKVLAERADSAGGFAVEGPQTVILFDERSNRRTRAAVSRAARDVA